MVITIPSKSVSSLLREIKKAKLIHTPYEMRMTQQVAPDGKTVLAKADVRNFEPTAVSQCAKVYSVLGKPFITKVIPAFCREYFIKALHHANAPLVNDTAKVDFKTHNTVKFVPYGLTAIADRDMDYERVTPGLTNYYPRVINEAPFEEQVGDTTYRMVANRCQNYSNDFIRVHLCVPHTSPLYNYLDRGFLFQEFEYVKKTGVVENKTVIANELTFENMLVFILCNYSTRFPDMLQDKCFIHPERSQVYRIRMEKALALISKPKYDHYLTIKAMVEAEYAKCATLQLIEKLNKNQAPHIFVNDIKISKVSASYETLSVEAPNFIETLKHSGHDLSRQYDIYQMIKAYCDGTARQLEAQITKDRKADYEMPEFTINKIPIKVTYSAKNHHRSINGFHINAKEIGVALYRASCHQAPEDYTRLLREAARMSLEWRDALAGGLPVKIHRDMTPEDYTNPLAPNTAPKIRFRIVDKKIHTVLNETGETVRIKLGTLIAGVRGINRLTNNHTTRAGGNWHRRDYTWARTKLQELLIKASTFENAAADVKEVVIKDITHLMGKEERERIQKENEAAKAAAAKAAKDAALRAEAMKIDKEKAIKYFAELEAQREKAIKKSEEFLANAVKHSGAQEIIHNGEKAYLVKGNLRSYIVIKSTGQVFEAKTKRYICIVNADHHSGVGFDTTASRLLVLKNDSLIQDQVTTLRGLKPDTEEVNVKDFTQVELGKEDEEALPEILEIA